MLEKLGVIIINYQTPDLLKKAVETFRFYYPSVEMLIVDNGSRDNSLDIIDQLVDQYPVSTSVLKLSQNIYHGPAMHAAISKFDKQYIFILDSDTETLNGLFLETMVNILRSDDQIYCVGRLDLVDKRGFLTAGNGIPAVRTPYMMLRRDLYNRFHPFEHHGLPTLKNFMDAHTLGFTLIDFPIETFIRHIGRGTAARFGYQLGIRSKVDFILHKLGF